MFGPHIGGDEEDDEFAGEGEGEGRKESVSVETVKGWIERSKSGEVSSFLLSFRFVSFLLVWFWSVVGRDDVD